ncbi:MAG: methyltransferase domain-containing protein [Alphaproteobacteria bacterium]|nr:methyltransferase domain-containing protein [Alphaproteobacteria bacterium]
MSVPQIFDRKIIRRHRDRAARHFPLYDFLQKAIAERLVERFLDIDGRIPMRRILSVGDALGHIEAKIISDAARTRQSDIEFWLKGDLSWPILAQQRSKHISPPPHWGQNYLQMDEEKLPFSGNNFSAIFSHLSLHWVNDLPGALIQYHRALENNGIFLAALWGENTLSTLREAFIRAEWEEYGGAAPRFSPALDGRDMAQMMVRAGFSVPVVDRECLNISYRSLLSALQDLRAMAENNALRQHPPRPLTRRILERVAEFYPKDADGRMTITMEVILLTGWRI